MTELFKLDLTAPGVDWAWEDLREASRAWGAPEALVPFLSWQRNRFAPRQAPIVWVNNEDLTETEGFPPEGLVREALIAGAGLYVELSEPFDLRRLGDALHTLTSFEVAGTDPSLLLHPELVSEMHSAQDVSLIPGLGALDFSALQALKSVSIWDADQLSGLEAPNVVSVNLQLPHLPRDLTLPPKLASIWLRDKRADLTSMGELPELRQLFTYGVEHVDLALVGNAIHLDTVVVLHVKSVSNLAALAGKQLDQLTIDGPREMGNQEALLGISARHAHLVGPALDVSLAHRLNEQHGWVVVPKPPRPARPANLFTIHERDEDVELVFGDFAWAAEQLGVENVDLTVLDIERLALEAIRSQHPNPEVTVDSEAEGVYLIVRNVDLARQYSAAIDRFFGNRRKLRAAYRQLAT